LAELWQLLHEETQRRRQSRRGAAEATVPVPRFLLQRAASAEAATPEVSVGTEGVGPPPPAVPSPRFAWTWSSQATGSGQHVPRAPSPTRREDSRARISWQHAPPPPAPMRWGEYLGEHRATHDGQRVPPAPSPMRWGQSTSAAALLQLQLQLQQQQQHRQTYYLGQREFPAISSSRWSPSASSTTDWDSRRAVGHMHSEVARSAFPEGPAENNRARRRRARRRQNRQRNQSRRLPEVRPPPLLESVMEVPWPGTRTGEVVSVVSAMVNQLPTAAPAA